MRTQRVALMILALMTFTAYADTVAPAERRAILDAIRGSAAQEAGQPLKIKVDQLNVDDGWAVLVGELVAQDGGSLDWSKSQDCQTDFDRMLWAVLAQRHNQWQIEEIYICASEPPWWYLQENQGLIWPCGVYAGLTASEVEGTLEDECRRERSSPSPAAKQAQ